jgi:hypothetical protein
MPTSHLCVIKEMNIGLASLGSRYRGTRRQVLHARVQGF